MNAKTLEHLARLHAELEELEQRVNEQATLITELCEALAESGYYAGTGSLIARAREATRKF